jgi:hypothetical protein
MAENQARRRLRGIPTSAQQKGSTYKEGAPGHSQTESHGGIHITMGPLESREVGQEQARRVASLHTSARETEWRAGAAAGAEGRSPTASLLPPPLQADLSDIEEYEYPASIECPGITVAEVEKAVSLASPNKAPGNDGITNGILYKTLDILLPSLCKLFKASLRVGYYPAHFKDTITAVLRNTRQGRLYNQNRKGRSPS